MDGCLGTGVAFQINICGSIREADWGLHESTEYGKVGRPDKVDEQCLGPVPQKWQDQVVL